MEVWACRVKNHMVTSRRPARPPSPPSCRRPPLSTPTPVSRKPLRVGLAVANLVLFSALAVAASSLAQPGEPEHEPVDHVESAPPEPAGPVVEERTHRVRKGQTMGAILQSYGVTRVHELVEVVAPHVDLGRVRVGDELQLTTVDGVVTAMSYRFSADETLLVALGDDIRAEVETVRYDTRLERVRIPIEGSLWQSAIDRGFSPAMVLEMSKVFEDEVDFATELRPGAVITAVVDRLELDGELARYESLHALQLENRGESWAAVYFDGSEERSGWYTPRGASLEQVVVSAGSSVATGFGPPFAFVDYRDHQSITKQRPLGAKELRIGSDFYERRCKGRCRHSALDFRAAQGTPLVAIGNGKVSAITKTSSLCGAGVQVTMSGSDGHSYSALYCHMSKVQVKVGQRVKKGQTLGRSGGTPGTWGAGNSFGPHLHLELRRRDGEGKYRLLDPLPMIDWRPFDLNVDYTKGHEPKAPEPVVQPPTDITKTPEAADFANQRDRWMGVLLDESMLLSEAARDGASAG
jgi:murein DD-endopeptidase MepM/ murein hydrolase activator NlpD